MKRLDDWFRDYGQSHQHPVNVAIHKVAVPGIYLCILALLWCLPAGPLPASFNWAGWWPSRCWSSTCGCR